MKHKVWLTILIVVNIFLVAIIIYACAFKTDLMKRTYYRITDKIYCPTRNDDDCVQSWNSCIRKLNIDVDIVFFGNSITEGGEFQDYFPNKKVVVMGYIGEDTKGMLRRVQAISYVHPEQVFLMAGINGLKNQSMNDFAKWYEILVDSIYRSVPSAKIYCQSILPVSESSDFCTNSKIKSANDLIKNIAEGKDFTFIDLYSKYAINGALDDTKTYDGVHLYKNAYNIWAKEISAFIN